MPFYAIFVLVGFPNLLPIFQDLKLILPQLAAALRWDCHISEWPVERKVPSTGSCTWRRPLLEFLVEFAEITQQRDFICDLYWALVCYLTCLIWLLGSHEFTCNRIFSLWPWKFFCICQFVDPFAEKCWGSEVAQVCQMRKQIESWNNWSTSRRQVRRPTRATFCVYK